MIAISLFYFLLSLIYRNAHIDDFWLGEYAYWFSKLNYVKSELLRGFESYEKQLFVYHKLFIMAGGMVIRLGEFNIYLLKSISLIFFFLTFFISFKIIRDWNHIGNKYILFLLYSLFLMVEPHLFEYSFVFRPEVMLMAFGLLNYYLFNQGMTSGRKLDYILSGLISGICVLIHLNGLVFVIAGGLILLKSKKWLPLSIFSISAIIATSLYFWDINNPADFQLFLSQFKNDPALDEKDFEWYTYIIHIIKEHERFFHSPTEIFISSLFFVSLFYNYNYLKNHHPIFINYYGIAIIALAILCYGKTPKYMVIYMPFYCMVPSLAIYRMLTEESIKRQVKNTFYFLFFLFLISSFVMNANHINDKYYSELFENKIPETSPEKSLKLKPGSKILASLAYTFEYTDKYQLQGFQVYRLFRKKGKYSIADFDILKMAEKFSNEYLFLGQEELEEYQINHSKIAASNFILVHHQPGLMILKKKKTIESNHGDDI